ncbi:MAG: outer membrane protein transport protein, partial [Lentimicrobiaceae bacterium]|nr:outer membrane protein transport protein [Lentimicrobiaceae bacterium]
MALFICCISLMQISINAQNEIDALRFSETDWQGTARFMGAGKAFGAVGAEFSALNLNPATIGLYKKSEVTFTPLTISIYKNNSDYNGTSTLAQAVKYNIGSAGIVLAFSGISSTLWKKFQVGFGYNRIKNFNNVFSMEGRNSGSTIGSVFAAGAEGYNFHDVNDENIWPTELWAAWESYLINNKNGSATEYEALMEGVDMFQSSHIIQKGGIDEMVFSLGTNYDDKLFLGATIGLPVINYTENRNYFEKNDRYTDKHNFQSFKMDDKLTVNSSGINLKLGAIYQPADFVRVGFAFHTPTYYGNVKDRLQRTVDFSAKEFYQDTIIGFSNNEGYVNQFNYSLTTPLRAMVNVAFFIQQRAFISAEYEFADYSMATMYASNYNFSEENKTIQKMYGFSHIARIGAEFNVNQVFAVRAGYNYISS